MAVQHSSLSKGPWALVLCLLTITQKCAGVLDVRDEVRVCGKGGNEGRVRLALS